MPLFGQYLVLLPVPPLPARANEDLVSGAELLNPGGTEEGLRNNLRCLSP